MAGRAALGFSVHTGWAAMVAVAAKNGAVLGRRRLVLLGDDPERPRFVFHAASKLPLDAAERLVAASQELSYANALADLREAIGDLRDDRVVACGIVGSQSAIDAPLESVLRSHALIHTAEGRLFREAVRRACEAVGLATIEVSSRDLRGRGAASLGVAQGNLDDHLATVGRAAGRPWAKDQRDAYLAAAIALA
jgi:hypothetical protein